MDGLVAACGGGVVRGKDRAVEVECFPKKIPNVATNALALPKEGELIPPLLEGRVRWPKYSINSINYCPVAAAASAFPAAVSF